MRPNDDKWSKYRVTSVVRRMNEVTLRRVRLVLGWVTVFGRVYHLLWVAIPTFSLVGNFCVSF